MNEKHKRLIPRLLDVFVLWPLYSWLGKFKKFFNISQINGAKLLSVGYIAGTIYFWGLIIAIEILQPCSVEAFQFCGGQERLKCYFGLVMQNKNLGSDYAMYHFIRSEDILFQHKNLIYERGTECRSSFVEFSDADRLQVAIPSKAITYKFSDDIANYSPDGKTYTEIKDNHIRYFFLGFGIGGCFVIFCLHILPLFIHRTYIILDIFYQY